METVDIFFFFYVNDVSGLKPAAMHFRKALAAGATKYLVKILAGMNLAKSLRHKLQVTKTDAGILEAILHYQSFVAFYERFRSGEREQLTTSTAELLSEVHEIKKTT